MIINFFVIIIRNARFDACDKNWCNNSVVYAVSNNYCCHVYGDGYLAS